MESCSNNKKKIVIAIDGFSSCGKSTFAREIAARMGYIFIDTGAMYRAVTLYALRHGAVDGGWIDEARLVAMLPDIRISFRFNAARGASDVYLDGENVEREIRSIGVSNLVSRVSQIGAVREQLVRLQQQMGSAKGVVMDGRDIGTVVFPDAELKIFMTADPAVRAMRRYEELKEKGQEVPLAEIEENIRSRDLADQTRAIGPLRQADDALVLDNSHMTVDEQMAWVQDKLKALGC
ncbi:MAG: (d)CMP kinase [Rikenellaceae bacterium]|nr:(d)CMP kinase [Rikenellaceae bacterium]